MKLTQADWTPESDQRRRLFWLVADQLNAQCRIPEFVVQDDQQGPLIHHVPAAVRIAIKPSMPANPEKPFDIWVRLTHRFPVRADGSFNVKLVVQRVKEVRKLRLPEVP